MGNLDNFKIGKYRHYKGNEYDVIDTVRHSETGEWMVLYRPCYGEGGMWVRPFEMFYENVVDAHGSLRPRFEFIKVD